MFYFRKKYNYSEVDVIITMFDKRLSAEREVIKKMRINIKRLWLYIPFFGLGFLYYLTGTLTGNFIACPFHKYLHLDCPGCGSTRMAVALIHLDFYQAFRFNPLVFILLPAIFVMVSYLMGVISFEEKYIGIYVKCLEIIVVIAVVFSVMRNIPLFYFLKPTVIR